MNATRFTAISAALIGVTLAAGCAGDRDDRTAQMEAPMTPVAAAPMVRQPEPGVTYAPAPMPMAAAAADPATTTTPSTIVASSSNTRMPDNMMTERAPRADRN